MLKCRYVSARSRTRAVLVAILLGGLELASMPLAGAKALVSETLQKVLPSDGPINAVSFNRADGRLAVLSNFANTISVFSPHGWELERNINRYGGTASAVNSLVFTRDGNVITSTAVGDYSHDPRYANTPLADPRYARVDVFALVQYSTLNGKIIGYFPNPSPSENNPPTEIRSANSFTCSSDGSLLAAVVVRHVVIFDEHSGLEVRTVEIPQPPDGFRDQPISVAISSSGVLAIGTLDGFIHLFSPTGTLMRSIEAYGRGEYLIRALAFSPDGKFLATGKAKNFDGHRVGGIAGVWVTRKHDLVGADIWTPAGAHIAQLIGPPNVPGGDDAPRIFSLSWNPDGSTLAEGDARGLNVWKIENGKAVLVLNRPIQSGSYSVAYAQDGTLAAAANQSVLIFK